MDNNKTGEIQKQGKRILKIIDNKKTFQILRTRLDIIKKIIYSLAWLDKNKFTSDILYEIQKFVFPNPLCLISPIYKHVNSKKMMIYEKRNYILANANFQRNQETKQLTQQIVNNGYKQNSKSSKRPVDIHAKTLDLNSEYQKLDSLKSGQYAISIKVNRCWKSCKLNYANSSLKQIITKSKHFLDFLKNVKIDNPKNLVVQTEKHSDNQNFEQKEAKLYTLICQNYDYTFSKIAQIQQNQKHKKLDDFIAKTYVQMMNKNIVILSAQKNNFNPISYKSQGKYIYIQNSLELPLFSQRFERVYSHLQSFKIQRCLLKLIPYLQCNSEGEWNLKNIIERSLELFQQNGKQIDRGHGLIIDRFFNCFQYDDFSIMEI